MTEEINNVNDALNEYFRLKSKFEIDFGLTKKKIINNKNPKQNLKTASKILSTAFQLII